MSIKKTILASIAVLFLCLPALAHDWYPLDCCSKEDCFKVPCDELIETAKGITWQGYEFTKNMIRVPQDSFCHVCIHKVLGTMCVFPQPTS